MSNYPILEYDGVPDAVLEPDHEALGILLPRQCRDAVSFRAIVHSEAWLQASAGMALPLAIGVDTLGQPVVSDLAQMPHMLVAGGEGEGKTALLSAMLAGLLLCRRPDELRLLLIAPKRDALSRFEGVPHLSRPVAQAPEQAADALAWAVQEMTERYSAMSRQAPSQGLPMTKRTRPAARSATKA